MKRVTLQDIAKQAGVSAVTVSNVLNHKGKTSEEKTRDILEIAEKMGYRPDSIARSFRQKRSNIIGIILPHEYPEPIAAILAGAVSEAKKYGQSILLSPDYRTVEEEQNAFKDMVDTPIEALIYYPRNYHVNVSSVPGLHTLPLVGMLRRNMGISIPKIYGDYLHAGFTSTKYLISLGRRRIAFVYCAGDYSDIHSVDDLCRLSSDEATAGRFVFDDFFAGYRIALEEAGLELNMDHVFLSDLYRADGERIAQEILTRGDIDAILVGGTQFALGMYSVFQQQGISIPDDISVISYTSDSICEALTPTLTSCAIPFEEMGRRAVQLCNQMLNGNAVEDVILKPKLILMNSTSKSKRPDPH